MHTEHFENEYLISNKPTENPFLDILTPKHEQKLA